MKTSPKLIQIVSFTTNAESTLSDRLFGLDSEGRLWVMYFGKDNHEWKPSAAQLPTGQKYMDAVSE